MAKDKPKEPGKLMVAVARQRARHRSVDVVVAGFGRFKRNESSVSAVYIAYQAFFSLFPLLFALVGILGLILRGHESLRAKVLANIAKNVPAGALQDLITNSIRAAQHSAKAALGVGLVLLLYSGTGMVAAVERGLDRSFGVAKTAKFVMTRLRALGYLLSVGIVLAVSVAAGSLVGGAAGSILNAVGISGTLAKLAASAVALLVVFVFDVGLFVLTFWLLPNRKVKPRAVLPGAIIAAVWWGVLKTLGALYIAHSVKSASQVFGQFAVILGLLVFANLAAQLLLFTACMQAEMLGDPELVQVLAKDSDTAEMIKDEPAEVTGGVRPAGAGRPAQPAPGVVDADSTPATIAGKTDPDILGLAGDGTKRASDPGAGAGGPGRPPRRTGEEPRPPRSSDAGAGSQGGSGKGGVAAGGALLAVLAYRLGRRLRPADQHRTSDVLPR